MEHSPSFSPLCHSFLDFPFLQLVSCEGLEYENVRNSKRADIGSFQNGLDHKMELGNLLFL